MIVLVTRTNKTADGTYGNLSIDTNPFKCVTMERTSLIIPSGSYSIQWMWSNHFQQVMPLLIVPDRAGIEIHWANFPYQLSGCVALGTQKELSKDQLDESKIAWIAFIRIIVNQPNVMMKIVEDFGA